MAWQLRLFLSPSLFHCVNCPSIILIRIVITESGDKRYDSRCVQVGWIACFNIVTLSNILLMRGYQMTRQSIIGGSCHKYHFCRDKTFVATNM